MSLPETITSVAIESALTQTLKKPISLKLLEVQENDKGGNYCSDIYWITAKYTVDGDETQLQTVKLILKDLFENHTESSKESFMYGTVLPELNRLFEAVKEGGRFSPRVYLITQHQKGREQYLLEDLNASGYKVFDRLLGLNESQTKCVLEKLGQFHATSMVYHEKHPEIVADMKKSGYRNYIDFCEKMIGDNVAYVVKVIEKWPQFEGIVAKLKQNTGKKFSQKFLSCLERQDLLVTVIVHADLWIKNILIRENDGAQALDAVFVDYQACSLSSPGMDFDNFLLTSSQLEVYNSDEKRKALVQLYYESFRTTLLGLNFEEDRIPTLQMIETEFKKSIYFSYYCLLFNFPSTLLSEELAKDMNFDAFFDDKRMAENRKDMFSNERVLATYKYMLPILDKMGALD